MKKYYEILGLKEGATKQDIKKAFNKLSKDLDPKKNDNQDFFIEETKKLKEAYDKLMNSSILSTKKVLDKSIKKKDVPSNDRNNVKPNLDKNNHLKKIRIKQNVLMILIIALMGSNVYLFQQIKGDNNSASVAEDYAEDCRRYMNYAEDYAEDSRRYMNNAEDYMYSAEDYMNYAEDYKSQARGYADDAYYYSN